MSFKKLFLSFLLVPIVAAAPVLAAKSGTPKQLGTFGNWRAYSFTENNTPVCYMALTITTPPKTGIKRRTAHFLITQRPAEGGKDTISYEAGYNLKPESDVTLHIDQASFDLFTTQTSAWARDSVTDHKITAAIKQGKIATLTGTPSTKIKGTVRITDHLDLGGALQAYAATLKACGIEPDPSDRPSAPKKKTPYKPTISKHS